jgi:hypothetical protein
VSPVPGAATPPSTESDERRPDRVNAVPCSGDELRPSSPTVTAWGRVAAVSTLRKSLASLVTIAAAVGLIAFGTVGAFDETRGDFPRSVPGSVR